MKGLKIFLWAMGLLLVLAAGVALALVNLVDPNAYKPSIISLVKQHTGRDLHLQGDLELTLFPWLGVKASQVELANGEGFGPTPMLSVAEADIKIKLLSLLKEQLEIGAVVLRQPQINLSRRADGVANWDDLTAKFLRHGTAGATVADVKIAPPDAALLAGLAVQGISIQEGRVHWDDRVADRSISLKALNLSAGKLTPGEPLAIRLSAEVESNALPPAHQPAAIVMTTTARLAEDAESLSLNGTQVEAITPSMRANLSMGSMIYALRAGLAVADGVEGAARHDGNHTQLEIPSITFSLPDESMQLPLVALRQGDFNFTGTLAAAGVFSGVPALTASGAADAEIGDAVDLMERNYFAVNLPASMLKPVTLAFEYQLANSILTLNNLSAQFLEDGQPLADSSGINFGEISIPLDTLNVAAIISATLQAGAKLKLKTAIEKTLSKKLLKTLGID